MFPQSTENFLINAVLNYNFVLHSAVKEYSANKFCDVSQHSNMFFRVHCNKITSMYSKKMRTLHKSTKTYYLKSPIKQFLDYFDHNFHIKSSFLLKETVGRLYT